MNSADFIRETEELAPMLSALRRDFHRHAEPGWLEMRTSSLIARRLEELGCELKNVAQPVFLVGDGSILCYNTLKADVPNLVLPPEHRMHQRASGVALAALEQIAAGATGNGTELEPNYLRLSQAERERLAREQK